MYQARKLQNVGLNKADYALLYAVIVQEWQVYLLSGGMDMESVLNTPSHGLNEADLIQHFFKLWRHGFVECSHDESGPPVDPDLELLRRQFVYAGDSPADDETLLYRLTAAGGAAWEALASPDWTGFLRSSSPSSRRWVLGGGDRARVELLRKCPAMFPPPLIETEKVLVQRPWQATYWKILPIGYEITFEYDYSLGRSQDLANSACAEIFETWDKWHRSFRDVCDEYFKDA